MALPDGGPGVPIAFPAAVHWRVADHQWRRLRGPELHGVIVSGLSEQGVYLVSACAVRGAGDHVVARDQRRQPTGIGTIAGIDTRLARVYGRPVSFSHDPIHPQTARHAARRPRPRHPDRRASGGGRYRGVRARTGVNNDSLRQPDARLRALDAPASTPGARDEVYCTKVGSVHPGEMYIVGAHMDGIGWGETANDDGSGTALVMQLARIFSGPGVRTDRSIRFVLWNNEETGLNGSRAYVEQRQALQGKEDPPGSGKYPEPTWLGMIQHDMMLFDHGMPRSDGTLSPEQRPEADVNIEFQASAKFASQAQKLAWTFQEANEKYATDYPASVGSHMTNTDSAPFQDLVAAISLRENDRGAHIGAGWDPNWHQPTDLYSAYSNKDFRLGLNAAQTTLAALAGLVGTTIK